jgi:hypothetical protein
MDVVGEANDFQTLMNASKGTFLLYTHTYMHGLMYTSFHTLTYTLTNMCMHSPIHMYATNVCANADTYLTAG